ncbi:unnamed protein product [Phytophthora fragariaefolia]|uniref:Unnamed protein product n=1 Tax=Phytophthora fragariaefolia TaxID=1490495 RepID=A0A9W6YNX5_9STRA|nr:unnamed protein product [Phytophthora fragariaefolia]
MTDTLESCCDCRTTDWSFRAKSVLKSMNDEGCDQLKLVVERNELEDGMPGRLQTGNVCHRVDLPPATCDVVEKVRHSDITVSARACISDPVVHIDHV